MCSCIANVSLFLWSIHACGSTIKKWLSNVFQDILAHYGHKKFISNWCIHHSLANPLTHAFAHSITEYHVSLSGVEVVINVHTYMYMYNFLSFRNHELSNRWYTSCRKIKIYRSFNPTYSYWGPGNTRNQFWPESSSFVTTSFSKRMTDVSIESIHLCHQLLLNLRCYHVMICKKTHQNTTINRRELSTAMRY